MRRLGRHLSYANVMATIAVFISLGAGAYALSRNDVKSKHIAPGAVKLSDTNDKLRLKCPGRTVFVEGACLERAMRGSGDWFTAEADCISAGRRLPSPAELQSGRVEPGVALGEGNWTDDFAGFSDAMTTIADSGGSSVVADSNTVAYRCVARPLR